MQYGKKTHHAIAGILLAVLTITLLINPVVAAPATVPTPAAVRASFLDKVRNHADQEMFRIASEHFALASKFPLIIGHKYMKKKAAKIATAVTTITVLFNSPVASFIFFNLF